MGVVAISTLNPLSKQRLRIPRLAEDTWLDKSGKTISYLDIFFLIETNSHENLNYLYIVMDGFLEYAEDVSFMWYKDTNTFLEGVGGYMYSSGLRKIGESLNYYHMYVDGIECNVPKPNTIEIHVKNKQGIIEINFLEPIQSNEIIGIKIEVLLSRKLLKTDIYPTEVYFFEIYPYSHWIIGIDVLQEYGFTEENLIPIESYYLYVFLPPGYNTDRERTTKFLTLDLSKCEDCDRYCPFIDRASKLLNIPLNEVKKDREGIRYHLTSLYKWQSKCITIVFYQIGSLKIKLFMRFFEILVIGFIINVISGLVFNYDPYIFSISFLLLFSSIVILIIMFKKFHI